MRIDANGISMNYEVEGSGKWLVLVHGMGDNLGAWYNQVPVFSQRYRVLTYDVRGHGQTEAPEGEDIYRVNGSEEETPEPEETEPPEPPEEPTQDQEKEPSAEEKEKAFRSEWINLRQPGFSTYVHQNKERFRSASQEIQAVAKEKWASFYEDPWPIDNGGMIDCPNKEALRPIGDCDFCLDKPDCPMWE